MVQRLSPDPERRPVGTIRRRHRSAWRERWAQALASGARDSLRAPSLLEGSTSLAAAAAAVVVTV
jgi:hypothetical protein